MDQHYCEQCHKPMYAEWLLGPVCGKCCRENHAAVVGNKRRTLSKRPGIATMERWLSNGIAKATDGCKVEPDGTCPHGKQSWLLVLGYI